MKESRFGKIEFDDAPPTQGRLQMEAELRAFRALKQSIRKIVKDEVNKAMRQVVKNSRPRRASKTTGAKKKTTSAGM